MDEFNYYRNLSDNYKCKRARYVERLTVYNCLLDELSTIIEKINSVDILLEKSYMLFRNGGYFDGETPSRGLIGGASWELHRARNMAQTLISNTENLVVELKNKLRKLENEYEKEYFMFKNG